MFNQDIHRIGFACKYVHPDQSLPKKKLASIQSKMTEKSTTNAWLQRQTQEVAEARLWEIIQHNTQAVFNLVQYVSGLVPELRMVRLGSHCLPFYTHDNWSYFYQRADVRDFAEAQFARIGEFARKHDVRLSMHPGQYCVLGSDQLDVAARSLVELEYHADIIRWMGFGQQFQDFKCNIHLSGKRGAEGFLEALPKMSNELRNTLTVENDEYSSGLDDILELGKYFALVFDSHHHWIHSHEFITPQDDRFRRVIESWRGVRPAIHYSVSRSEYLDNVNDDELPDFMLLKESGYASTKLRAHSDYYTHSASNKMIAEFREYADIMCEAKMKNLSALQLYQLIS